MTTKQQKPDGDLLIRNYVNNGCQNATQAAIDAGYSEKSAAQSASRVLSSDKAKKAIEEYKKTELKAYVWSKQDKLIKLEKIANAAMQPCSEKGMININGAIAAIKEHNVMQGDNAPTEVTLDTKPLTINFIDAVKPDGS